MAMTIRAFDAGWVVVAACALAGCGGDGDGDVGAPLAPGAPWPKFRRDEAQTGRSAIRPVRDDAARPWVFATGKGIFSSPVIGADETIYIGSADRTFYAIDRDGRERWRFATGEIIDSSALLDDRGRIYFGSGDGHVYALDAATGAEIWRFAAQSPADTGGYINWFEGNVAMGTDGALYAPNDNFRVYVIDRDDGTSPWAVELADQTWSSPAVDVATGHFYLGNNNLLPELGDNTFAYAPAGDRLWSASSLGSVAASPLLVAEHGLVVVGGFDGYLHAYRTTDGTPAWSFATRDHLYASPALGDGVIVQPSADGTVYAVDAASGALRWQFDTRDPIRSSPAIDGDGNVYLGGGDGRLYVLGPDGALRFRMLLASGERNDLNSSPALGARGVYLGSESGEVFFVPYDYCLGPAGLADVRCEGPAVGEGLPADGAFLYYTTQLGAPLTEAPATIDPNQALNFSLFVRAGGDTRLALIDEAALAVTVTPATEISVVVSPDRRFVTVIPEQPFVADAGGRVAVQLAGRYLVDPVRTGLRMEGGTPGGQFDTRFDLGLGAPGASPPFVVPTAVGEAGSAFELYRLAAPLPSILPSYNQIGFDSMSFVGGFVEGTPERAIAWIVGGTHAADGATVVDPATRSMFPVQVTASGGLVTMENRGAFALEALALRITFDRFLWSTRLDATGAAAVTPTVHVSTPCEGIAFYGAFLRRLGFCNATTDRLTVTAATLYRRWGDGGLARPATGVGEVAFRREPARVVATITGSALVASQHAVGLLLVDAATGAPVLTGYGIDTRVIADGAGVISEVRLDTAGRALPASMRVYLMVDVSAVAGATLAPPAASGRVIQ
jgi:outer membrane protein assembly factor BamB